MPLRTVTLVLMAAFVRLTCALLIVLLSNAAIAADAWPQFRGPRASGVAEGTGLPEAWSATENVRW